MARWLGTRWGLHRLRPRRRALDVSLAVLPFDDLTCHSERESLSGGLTDEISTQLSRASSERLRLLPSCSAKAIKATPHPISAARQKGVDFLLGGSVLSIADRARVNAHLVCVRDDTQLWTDSYERVLGDVLDFYAEVARAIAAAARTKLRT
jgi:TolB-like protein